MKYKKLLQIGLVVFTLVLVLSPTLAFAQDGTCKGDYQAAGGLEALIDYGTCIIGSSVVPLIFILAFALFLWGVLKYVLNPSDETKRSEGRQFMLWGIIALFVMFAIWGLVEILGNTFGIPVDTIPQVKE